MPTRRPPASGEMPSLAMATRMRLRAFLVISMAALARGCWPLAVRRVMPANGSFAVSGVGTLMDCEVEVEMETVDIVESKKHTSGLKPILFRGMKPEAKASGYQ